MRSAERDGFMLILAVAGVGLAAAAMVILAGLAHSLIFDANQAYEQACHRNLTASALAWAQQNRDRIRDSSEAEQIQLDVSGLDIADGNLRITVMEPQKRTTKLQIDTECRIGTVKSKHSDLYLITSP